MSDSHGLGGWYTGLIIALTIVFVVVVLVATVLQLARRLGLQNRDIASALAAIRTNTDAMPSVAAINEETARVNEALARLRDHLRDIPLGGHK